MHDNARAATRLEIRRVAPHDATLFDRVAPDVFDAPIDAERLAAYLGEPNHCMLVAMRNGEVVGQVAAVIHRHPDKPTELYIDENLSYRTRRRPWRRHDRSAGGGGSDVG